MVGRKRFSAVPKTEVIEIEVLRPGSDGKPVPTVLELVGQHKDCHEVWIDVQMDVARREYDAVAFEDVEVDDPSKPGTKITARQWKYDKEAESRYRRDVLMACLPGLELPDADVLARDDGPWREILSTLGWWVAAEEEESDPEATGKTETGPTTEVSSPDSALSTVPTTGAA